MRCGSYCCGAERYEEEVQLRRRAARGCEAAGGGRRSGPALAAAGQRLGREASPLGDPTPRSAPHAGDARRRQSCGTQRCRRAVLDLASLLREAERGAGHQLDLHHFRGGQQGVPQLRAAEGPLVREGVGPPPLRVRGQRAPRHGAGVQHVEPRGAAGACQGESVAAEVAQPLHRHAEQFGPRHSEETESVGVGSHRGAWTSLHRERFLHRHGIEEVLPAALRHVLTPNWHNLGGLERAADSSRLHELFARFAE
mmetsp:Transcript_71582/g.181149  ORF Transcript_71582/g.181149 Transcript_71582/m.181149 type:complete len:254 (+) Transcript_71582:324-1085(+)